MYKKFITGLCSFSLLTLWAFYGGVFAANQPLPGQLLPLDPASINLPTHGAAETIYGYIATNPVNHDVYVVSTAGNLSDFPPVLIFRQDPATGLLTQQVAMPDVGYSLRGVEVDHSGKYVYFLAGSVSDSRVLVYSVNSDNGTLIQVSQSDSFSLEYASSITKKSLYISPSGKYMYVLFPDAIGAKLITFSIGAKGKLTLIASAEIENSGHATLVFSPSGLYAYGLGKNGNILRYKVNKNGVIEPINSSNPVTKNVFDFVIDPSGSYLYAVTFVNDGPWQLTKYYLGPDGGLQFGSVTPIGNTGRALLKIDPSGRFLYLALDSQIASYGIGQRGDIKLIGTPYYYGEGITFFQMTIDSSTKFAYFMTVSLSPELFMFKIPQPAAKQMYVGSGWADMKDTKDLTKQCSLNTACTLKFSAEIRSTSVTLTNNDDAKSTLTFILAADINDAGLGILTVSQCQVNGNLSDETCTNIKVDSDKPWIVNVPPPIS